MEIFMVVSTYAAIAFAVLVIANVVMLTMAYIVSTRRELRVEGFIVTFATGHKRFVTRPDEYIKRGLDVFNTTVKVDGAEIYTSQLGEYAADSFKVTGQSSNVGGFLLMLVAVGNDIKRVGFVKTFLAM